MVSTESVFDLDITENDIEFEEFNISRDDELILKFKYKSKDKDYIKKFTTSNTSFNEIVSIQKNNEENKNLSFHYYTFEKNIVYIVSIKFKEIDKNKYTLEKIYIIDFPSDNIKEIPSCEKTFNNLKDEFLIIKWKNIKKIKITYEIKGLKFYLAEINENQSKNLAKEFQNIKFKDFTGSDFTKSESSDYSVLMIEILKEGTKINIDIDKKKDDKGLSIGYIISISVGGLFILVIILFFVIRCIRKRKDVDFNKKAQEINEEKLLSDIE